MVIVEDVTTTGGSAIKAADAVRDAGGEVALVITTVDREEGATETFRDAGIPFRSLYKASEFPSGVDPQSSPVWSVVMAVPRCTLLTACLLGHHPALQGPSSCCNG